MANALTHVRDNQLETLLSAGAMRADANLLLGLLTSAATTPDRAALAPLADQVEANVAALDAIVASYRGYLAYGQDL